MRIVLDTSIICQDYKMSGTLFRTFFDGLNRTDFTLYIPRIVFDEAVNKYGEHLEKLAGKINTGIREFQKLTGKGLTDPISSIGLKTLQDEYRTLLHWKLLDIRAQILEYPAISHKVLVQRALDRRKPFDGEGKRGYRDALLWESILELVSDEQTEPIAFISRNTRDFADKNNKLHPDLLDDLSLSGGEKGKVVFFGDLGSFVEMHVKPTMEVLSDIQVQIANNEYLGLDIHSFLREELISSIGRIEFEPEDLGMQAVYQGLTLVAINNVHSIDNVDVRSMSTEEVLVDLTAYVEGDFDFFVFQADYPRLSEEEKELIWEYTWSDHYSAGSVELDLNLNLSLTFDTTSKQVTSIHVVKDYEDPEGKQLALTVDSLSREIISALAGQPPIPRETRSIIHRLANFVQSELGEKIRNDIKDKFDSAEL